jgi:hypothetical protein
MLSRLLKSSPDEVAILVDTEFRSSDSDPQYYLHNLALAIFDFSGQSRSAL